MFLEDIDSSRPSTISSTTIMFTCACLDTSNSHPLCVAKECYHAKKRYVGICRGPAWKPSSQSVMFKKYSWSTVTLPV